VKLVFEGQLFTADLTVPESTGIDVILGMEWLAKHNRMVSCNPRFIQLEHPVGRKSENCNDVAQHEWERN
jgi:hypothetical protein